ncbi:FtsX-like permease family protein [Lachnospiraceae bacterium MD1]|jgi:putative ABC transport system permease protein|uniref:FtsX-like permease family protein n=1 Tax=Variimorphobacter saccharofermentans TaxID=2755051 RepID=A0A839K130_9FIRM|nr:FtsX-like permease family protein [Variimorphobacter saccharofermentans]MBB2182431.1 FtsX-like permease family protein [Variimorphobacter saccharofermentans]
MWIKNLRQRKLQTLLIFLIIMLCSILLTGSMNILSSLDAPFQEFVEECDAASARVYAFDTSEDAVYHLGKEFSKLDIMENVIYITEHYIEENLYSNGKKLEVFANLTEYNEQAYGKVRYLEGGENVSSNSAHPLEDDECLLPASISNDYDIHVGDIITMQYTGKELSYKVKAIYTEPYQTSIAFDTYILINHIPDNLTRSTRIMLYTKDGISGKEIESSFREAHDGELPAFLSPIEDVIDNSLLVGRLIGALFFAIGVIMLLVSGLMIQFMIKHVMISDEKAIAVYKTMGYTSNDILFMYIKLYFVIVSIACIVGTSSSVFLSNTILSGVFENMGQLKVKNPLLPAVVCYLATVIFVLSIITLIIARTRNIKPASVLSGINYGGIKKKKYSGSSTLPFSPFGIAFRTFTREKKNAIGIFLTCIVTVFSVNFAIISLDVANNMRDNNDFWIGIDKCDAMITVSWESEYEFVRNSVLQDSRVDHIFESIQQERVILKWKKGMTQTYMNAFVYDDYRLANLPIVKGRNPQNGSEIALSTKMAKELKKDIGDYVEINLEGDKFSHFLVTGLFQSYLQLGSVCRLTTSAYTDQDYHLPYNTISVYLKDQSDTDAFISDLSRAIGGSGNILKRTDVYNSIMDMVVTPQQNAIPPMVVLVLLVAGINIYSIVLLKNLKSQKINGIYKCIGYTTTHLILSNLYYVGIIGLTSVLITLPVSIVIYPKIMAVILSMFQFIKYPVQYDYSHLIVINAMIILIFILSSVISSRSIRKVNARDLVQE